MREYKFRVFKKETGIMYYPEATQEQFNHYLQIGSGGFWLYDREGQLLCTSNWGDELMQFTGLKDKNGKDIYEGDILKSFSSSVPSYEVFYCKSCYRLKYKLKNGEYYDWGPLYRMEEIQWEGRLSLCPDVIGNIHDNPELLNAASATTSNSNMNIDPNEKAAEEVKEQAEQVSEQTESAEEGGTEG